MTESPYVFDVTESDFTTRVLNKSHEVPVLVDFWAAWCGPCKVLMPLLATLAEEYRGKFLLAKVNTDEQRELAVQFNIRSIPTVKVFRNGEVVEEVLGAQPESAIRALIERHRVRESDNFRAEAKEAYRNGNLDQALALLEQAARLDPDNHRVRIDLAGILLKQEAFEQAESLLKTLPRDVREEPEASALLGRLEFARIAAGTPELAALERTVAAEPGDSEARYQLGARKVLKGDYEGAMDQFLEILRGDRGFRDGAARNAMLATFNLLGGKGDLVTRYRNRMFNALH